MLDPVTATIPISPDPGTTSRSSGPTTLVEGIAANDAVGPMAPFTESFCAIPPSVDPRASTTSAPGVKSSRPSMTSAENMAPEEM